FGYGLQLVAQANDVRVNRARCRIVRVTPDFIEQVVTAQDLSWMAEEVFEQLKLHPGALHQLAVSADLAGAQIDLDVAAGGALLLAWQHLRAPEHCLDSRHQFANGKRFGHIVVGAELQANDFVDLLPSRRQHDDGHGGPFDLELLADVEAAEVRHHHIEQNQVWRIRKRAAQSGNAVRSGDDLVTFVFEVVAQPRDHVGLIFDNQDLCHLHPLDLGSIQQSTNQAGTP